MIVVKFDLRGATKVQREGFWAHEKLQKVLNDLRNKGRDHNIHVVLCTGDPKKKLFGGKVGVDIILTRASIKEKRFFGARWDMGQALVEIARDSAIQVNWIDRIDVESEPLRKSLDVDDSEAVFLEGWLYRGTG